MLPEHIPGKVLIASVATSSSVLLVGPLDAVNTQPGACSDALLVTATRARIRPYGASPDEGRRGRRLESPLTNVSLAVEVAAACVGETAALLERCRAIQCVGAHDGQCNDRRSLSLHWAESRRVSCSRCKCRERSHCWCVCDGICGRTRFTSCNSNSNYVGWGGRRFPNCNGCSYCGSSSSWYSFCVCCWRCGSLRRRKVQRDQARTDLRIQVAAALLVEAA